MIGGARKPETPNPHHNQHPPQKGGHRPRRGPVVSGPNSVPNTTPQPAPATFLNPAPLPEGKSNRIRTNHRSVPPGTYLLIFHP